MHKLLFVAGVVLASAAAHADLLWDYGMSTGTFGGDWQNQTALQNFADMATFGNAVSVSEYDYYTTFDPSTFGTMHVKVLADNAGTPGSLLDSQDVAVSSFSVDGVYSGNTVYRVVLDLSPINLGPGSYWFGASGNNFEAAQVSLNPGPGDSLMAQFSGSSYSFMTSVGDQAFQLYGSPVPEPASCLILGSLGLMAARRRKKA